MGDDSHHPALTGEVVEHGGDDLEKLVVEGTETLVENNRIQARSSRCRKCLGEGQRERQGHEECLAA